MTIDLLNATCRENFDAFAARAFQEIEPGVKYEWSWHIGCIADHLQALYEDKLPGGKRRLAINVPPRSLKSYLASIAFPAWVMGREPHEKFITTSYGFGLAKEMSQKSRILIESDWYMALFPHMRIDDGQNEKHNFWTTKRGMYYSSAIMSVTGKGAGYVILDDPINPKEAFSDTIRLDTNSTIRSTIPTRFNDPRIAKWLMIMQRLHDADPTGDMVIKDPDRWHLLKLPGENLTSKPIIYTLGDKKWVMEPGELLFPARLTRKVLDELREDLMEYNYAGQILQEPVPIGGGELNSENIQYYANGSVKPHQMNVAIICDAAGGDETNKKKKKKSDFTVFSVLGLAPDNNLYLLDMVRDRLNPTERIDTLFMLHRKWNDLCGKPPKVGYEKYGLMTDTHYIKEKQKTDAYHFPLIELGGTMNKEDRIRKLIPDLDNMRIYVPHTLFYVDCEGRKIDLVQELISEMKTFPRSRYDDIIDSISRYKDEDLGLIFPKPNVNMVQRARQNNINRAHSAQSWRDF